jgi:hypothetical protein
MANRLRLRLGDNEIELEGNVAFIKSQLADFITRIEGTSERRPTESGGGKGVPPRRVATLSAKGLSPAEYIKQKQPRGGTERLLVLGKYLEEQRGATAFTRVDIKALAGLAKIVPPKSIYYTRGVQQGLVQTQARGRYALTLSGEAAVNAMPAKKSG